MLDYPVCVVPTCGLTALWQVTVRLTCRQHPWEERGVIVSRRLICGLHQDAVQLADVQGLDRLLRQAGLTGRVVPHLTFLDCSDGTWLDPNHPRDRVRWIPHA